MLTSTLIWCSVSDRLPPVNEPCVVLCQGWILMMGWCVSRDGMWVKYGHTDKRECRQDFTHWCLYPGLVTGLKG